MQIFENRDPRKHGSGNIGMSNVMRTSGYPLGLLTLIGDLSKGWFCVWLAMEHMPTTFLVSLSAVLVVLGHCYSAYLDFKGGKGVATTAGVILALSTQPFYWLILIWAAAKAVTEKASQASMAAVVAVPVLAHLYVPLYFWPLIGICLIIIWRHRWNFTHAKEALTKSTLQ